MSELDKYGLRGEISPTVYDPLKVKVMWNGEQITGFASDTKIAVSRRLNGVAFVKVRLQAHSPWVLHLKKALSHNGVLDVEYLVDGPYAENLRFLCEMYVSGYDVDYTGSIPVFVFTLKDITDKGRSR